MKLWDISTGVEHRYGGSFLHRGVENDKAKELRVCEVSRFIVYEENVDPDGQHS